VHLVGEVHHRVDVQDAAALGLRHELGGDDGDKDLLVNRATVPGKHVVRLLGIQIDARQDSFA
jgi:hypothetical protein